MKKIILLAIFCIIVHAQGITIKLTQSDVNYLMTKIGDSGTRECLRHDNTTIRNNSAADNILLAMKLRK